MGIYTFAVKLFVAIALLVSVPILLGLRVAMHETQTPLKAADPSKPIGNGRYEDPEATPTPTPTPDPTPTVISDRTSSPTPAPTPLLESTPTTPASPIPGTNATNI